VTTSDDHLVAELRDMLETARGIRSVVGIWKSVALFAIGALSSAVAVGIPLIQETRTHLTRSEVKDTVTEADRVLIEQLRNHDQHLARLDRGVEKIGASIDTMNERLHGLVMPKAKP